MRYAFLFFMSFLFLMACETTEDNVEPTITVAQQSPQPRPGMVCGQMEDVVYTLTQNDTLEILLELTDNEALSQLKVDIHNNFDCHGHGGSLTSSISAPSISAETETWNIIDITNLSGLSQPVSLALTPPNNPTSGFYHFQLQAIDEAGNDASPGFYTIRVLHANDTLKPLLRATNPPSTSSAWNKGERITFEGEVTDNTALSNGGNALIYLARLDENSGNFFFENWEILIPDGTGTSYTFSQDYTVPNTLPSGSDHTFFLGATDGVRNIATPVTWDVTVN